MYLLWVPCERLQLQWFNQQRQQIKDWTLELFNNDMIWRQGTTFSSRIWRFVNSPVDWTGTLTEISFVWRLLDQAQGVEKTISSTNLPSWIHYSLNQQFLNSRTTFKSTLFKIYYCLLHHIAFSTVYEHWHLLRMHIIYMHSLAASVPTKDVKYSTFHRYFRCACTSQSTALFMYV